MHITNSQQAKQIIQKNKKIKVQDHMLDNITPNEAEKFSIKIAKDGIIRSGFELLSSAGVTFN